jgi:hypothetical protein
MKTQDILREAMAGIDDREELRFHESNPRRLSEQDHDDLRLMANAGGTIYDFFRYANRPKHEVIRYLQEHAPSYLEQLLLNTLKQKAAQS